jgi:hypothetical protein
MRPVATIPAHVHDFVEIPKELYLICIDSQLFLSVKRFIESNNNPLLSGSAFIG